MSVTVDMLKWVGVDDAFGASRGSDKWASHAISLQPFHGKKKVFLPQLFAPLSYNSAPHFSWRLSLTVFPALSKYANYKMVRAEN